MKTIKEKVTKKPALKKVKSVKQEVITEKHVITAEDIEQNAPFANLGLKIGDEIEVVTGLAGENNTLEDLDSIVEKELPEERYFDNKKVVKVATTVVNGKEYTEITTIDGCVYLDPIA